MKIAVITAVWGRVHIAQIWWKATYRLREAFAGAGMAVEIYAAGSEDDHYDLCNDYNGHWIEQSNDFLGAKFNAVVQKALADGADYILIMGSDDVMSPGLIEEYIRLVQSGVRYAGVGGVYFYELKTRRAMLFRGYPLYHHRHKEPVGAGRLIHRSWFADDILPWDPTLNQGLDYSITKRLGLRDAHLIRLTEERMLVDIKSETNIWTFLHLRKVFPLVERVDRRIIQAAIPELEDVSESAA